MRHILESWIDRDSFSKPRRVCRTICPLCEAEYVAEMWSVVHNTSKSCGCSRGVKQTKHGHSKYRDQSGTYMSWMNMKARCLNPHHHRYYRYGGRGISICDRWLMFENFLADLGEKPGKGWSLDRLNPDGNYEPSNCEWITIQENSRRRHVSDKQRKELNTEKPSL